MRLFIAEKPSLGRSIAEALPGPHVKAENCIFCGKTDVVTWSAGHILVFYEPEDYNPAHKKWDIVNIPHIPQEWKYKERADAKSLHLTIKKYLALADEVVNAGDADREGQVLIDELLEYYQYKGKTNRLLVTDNNPAAIKTAISNMKPNQGYKGLSAAGRARAMADWLLGLNLTRLYTLLAKKNNHYGGTVLSIGRVQTPVLGLIVRRDVEIENFVSKPFYSINASFMAPSSGFEGTWQAWEEQAGLDDKKRLVDKDIALALQQKFQSTGYGIVKDVGKKRKVKVAPLPHSLPTLQIEASKKYNISPSDTLQVVQKLYEAGVVTYPRSDCQYLPESKHVEAARTFSAITYLLPELAAQVKRTDLNKKHAAFNDSKVTEHYAIIPTGTVMKLDSQQKNIFSLIALRYIAIFWPTNYEYSETRIEVELADESFVTTNKVLLNMGWYELFKESQEQDTDTPLPDVTKNMKVENCGIRLEEKHTTPPERYTEATLLAAMSSIHKYVQDPDIRRILKENEGIGTAATQAEIINKIYLRVYAEKKGKQIISTAKGRTLIHSLPDIITQPDLTAIWEKKMSAIAQNNMRIEVFLTEIENQLAELISLAVESQPDLIFAVEGTTRGKNNNTVPCHKCGAPLRFIDSAKGTFWICSNQECKATFSDYRGKPAKPIICPKCKKNELKKLNGKNGFFWVCNCGYTASDEGGKPQATRVCKKCGSIQKKFISKSSKNLYWKCVDCGAVDSQ